MQNCAACLKPKGNLTCETCQDPLCKACAIVLEEEGLNFLKVIPLDLQHELYCPTCYNSKALPALETFRELMARARDVNVFYKSQSKESRFVRRTEKPIRIEGAPDRDEAILRLAFRAVEAGFNSLLDVDLDAEKVRHGGWQSSIWHGTAIPANITAQALNRRFLDTPN